jgi:hypothetical protein
MKHQIVRIFHLLCLATALVLPASLAAESVNENTLPAARTLKSVDGRTIDVVIVSKSATAIKAKKADGKEFEITLDKLSDADKAFVAGLGEAPVDKSSEAKKLPTTPIPFQKSNPNDHVSSFGLNYGYHAFIRVGEEIYAIKTEIARDYDPSVSHRPYAITYEITKFKKAAAKGRIIESGKADDSKTGDNAIDCRDFQIRWGPSDKERGGLNFTGYRNGSFSVGGVPSGTEYYNQQFPNLDSIANLDPNGWKPVRN